MFVLTGDELRRAIDTAIDGMIVIHSSGTVLLYNAACERHFGYTADEVLGNNVSMLMPSPDRESHDTYLESHLRTGSARIIGIGRDVLGRREDGSTFPMRLSVGELRDGDNTLLFVGTIHDLTERQRARERIEELQTELMRVSRARRPRTIERSGSNPGPPSWTSGPPRPAPASCWTSRCRAWTGSRSSGA